MQRLMAVIEYEAAPWRVVGEKLFKDDKSVIVAIRVYHAYAPIAH